MQEILVLLPFLALLGGVAGILAGLLGIGGGIVLVPGIYFILTTLGHSPESNMHVALGTSLAIIVPTGFSSARAHWKKGVVRMDLVRLIGPGIVAGAMAGTVAADNMSGGALKAVFAVALFLFAIVMAANPAEDRRFELNPSRFSHALAGGGIGFMSALMGIGGATISVPYMSLCGVQVRQAVGTAAALGLVIAVPSSLGYLLSGLNETDLPPFTAGYVSLPAFAVISPLSVTAAPLGAKIAHRLPVGILRKVFSVFMAVVSVRMLAGVIYG